MRLCRITGLSFTFALGVCACGGPIVRSTQLNSSDVAQGFVYYLPKQLIKIEVSRTLVAEDPKKVLEKAKATEAALSEAANARKRESKRLESALAVAGDDGKEELRRQLALSNAFLVGEVRQLKAASEAVKLATEYAPILGSADTEPKYRDAIKVTLLPAVADTDRRFMAKLDRGKGMRSDDFTLASNAAGLLTSTDFRSEDQTAQVLVEAFTSLGSVASLPSAFARKSNFSINPQQESSPSSCGPFNFEAVVDPSDDRQLNEVHEEIGRICAAASVRFVLDGIFAVRKDSVYPARKAAGDACVEEPDPACNNSTSEDAIAMAKKALSEIKLIDDKFEVFVRTEDDRIRMALRDKRAVSSDPPHGGGIYYRRKLPHILDVYVDGKRVQSQQIEIPNGAPAELLELERVALAQSDHQIKLENGMLTEHGAVLPSSALEVPRMVGKLAQAIIAIPAGIFQLKIDTTAKQKELTEAELAYLTELAKLNAELARRRSSGEE